MANARKGTVMAHDIQAAQDAYSGDPAFFDAMTPDEQMNALNVRVGNVYVTGGVQQFLTLEGVNPNMQAQTVVTIGSLPLGAPPNLVSNGSARHQNKGFPICCALNATGKCPVSFNGDSARDSALPRAIVGVVQHAVNHCG